MHLLPLMHGVARLNIAPRPAVALFFSGPDMAPAPDLAGVAGSFGLTKGEVRLLERIVLGDDIGQAAEKKSGRRANLGIPKPVGMKKARIRSSPRIWACDCG